jgi:CheY-like chemotaxis protein
MSHDCILVIDDDQDIRETLQDVLCDAGYSVLLAANGAEALALLGVEEPPSLILLDLKMPGMDAFAFRAAQAADQRIASVPVVILSASGDLSKDAESLGAAGYIEKPVKLDMILREVSLRCGTASSGPMGSSS